MNDEIQIDPANPNFDLLVVGFGLGFRKALRSRPIWGVKTGIDWLCMGDSDEHTWPMTSRCLFDKYKQGLSTRLVGNRMFIGFIPKPFQEVIAAVSIPSAFTVLRKDGNQYGDYEDYLVIKSHNMSNPNPADIWTMPKRVFEATHSFK